MFVSFHILATTRGCTWDALIPPSLLLENQAVALMQTRLAHLVSPEQSPKLGQIEM